jgi:hypothetical protein
MYVRHRARLTCGVDPRRSRLLCLTACSVARTEPFFRCDEFTQVVISPPIQNHRSKESQRIARTPAGGILPSQLDTRAQRERSGLLEPGDV